MSFGGFGGFGQNNNQQQSSGFGGFGNTNNTTSGFGAAQNTSGAFGSSTTTNPFGGFGGSANTGGFGSTTNNNNSTPLFGGNNTANKPAFGTTASTGGGGLFGATQSNTTGGFGGFGQSNNNQSSGFTFGQKPGTLGGSSTAQGQSLFGGGATSNNSTPNAFGSTNANTFGSGTALSGQAVPPPQGTHLAPFTPKTEKDGQGASSVTNNFQSITFQDPYQKYSFEELRLADYNNGRKNASGGQAGAFGASTGFGGFNQTSGAGFGSTPNTNPFGQSSSSTPFGQSNNNSGGFGSNTGGGLFGQNKPAGGGLFGPQTSGQSSGGLFGNTQGGTTGGFGTSGGFGSANNNTTGGGLFGNQQTSKPGGVFGSNTATSGSTGFSGFGSTSNTGGGLFGSNNNNNNTGSTPFGGQSNNSTGTTGGLFGNSNQNQNKPAFGGFGSTTQSQPSGGLFGSTNNQSQPSGGLFGSQQSSAPSGGLFGNNTGQQQPSGGLFGSQQNNQQSGGLFGAKPAGTGGFGGFGNTGNNQPAPSGGLFGSAGNQQGSSLFGNKPQQSSTTGGGLFGNSFGSNQMQQSGTGAMFGGTPSNSQSGQQNQGQPQSLRSSLLEGNPYGASSIWSGLPTPTLENSGPLVTPLSASQRLNKEQSRPMHRLSPMSRLYSTPPRRGYGFSYSTYGTPSSTSSTPGSGSFQGSGFRGGSFGRSLAKSYSASSLRQQYSSSDSDSILAPGALLPGNSRYSSGSIRRLTIDRNLKTDLFTRSPLAALPPANANKEAPNGITNGEKQLEQAEQPQKLRKRVSFDHAAPKETTGTLLNGANNVSMRLPGDDRESPEHDQELNRSPRRQGGPVQSNGDTGRGKELAVVPEERVAEDDVSSMRLPHEAPAAPDPKPGEYWMRPSRAELSKMPREKLQHVKDFTVGRQGCGSVTFDREVDLTTVPLDDLYEKIVEIYIRSITVYPDANTKPTLGKGLNVPATLHLENSWPRSGKKPSSATRGPLFDKHVKRLRGVKGTDFVSYETQTGVWTFTVPHFTRYGLDYDDDEDEDQQEDESALTSPPSDLSDTTPVEHSHVGMELDRAPDESFTEDDTFGYKKKILPGAFGQQPAFEENENPEVSFLGDRSVVDGSDVSEGSDEEGSDEEMVMAGTYPDLDPTTEQDDIDNDPTNPGTPGRPLDLNGDWAEQLQRTISPRKQDRETLRELQNKVLIDIEPEPEPTKDMKKSKNEFRTSIDLMNSLFGQHEERMAAAKKHSMGSKGFEWPYPKRAKTFEASEMQEADQFWHASFKPHWTSQGALIFASDKTLRSRSGKQVIPTESRDIRKSLLHGDKTQSFDPHQYRMLQVEVNLVNGSPKAHTKRAPFKKYVELVEHESTSSTGPSYETLVWMCARVLFDDYEDKYTAGFTKEQKQTFADRIRKDRFCDLWEMLILRKQLAPDPKTSASPEELAFKLLSVGDVEGACRSLLENGDFHLATLVSEIENSDQHFRENMNSQLDAWRDQGVISEMNDEIRTLYELLAGNTTICKGRMKGVNEDRALDFAISKRWKLNWLQAFGLVLFYGILQEEPLEKAIEIFAAKLESGEEEAFPTIEDSDTLQDKAQSNAESPFWVILKMYAEMKNNKNRSIVLPQAIAQIAKPFDSRFAFQLHQALVASRTTTEVDEPRADQLAMDLSFEYSAAGRYVEALWTLLFLSDDQARATAIKDALFRHAASLPEYLHPQVKDPSTRSPEWNILENLLKIPREWRCEAKAMFYRSTYQPALEFQYLLQANLLDEAHETFISRVAPKLVINEHYGRLIQFINLFHHDPSGTTTNQSRIEDRIPSAHTGLSIYEDYASLMTTASAANNSSGLDPDSEKRIKRLSTALPELSKTLSKRLHSSTANTNTSGTTNNPPSTSSMASAGGSSDLVTQIVACKLMGEHLAKLILNNAASHTGGGSKKTQKLTTTTTTNPSALLNLPLTSHARLRYTQAGAMEYFRNVVVAAGGDAAGGGGGH